MSITYRSLLGGLTVIASIGMLLLPSQAGAQPEFDFRRNTPPVAQPDFDFGPPARVARQVSNVKWGNWQKASNAYEGRFGNAYSVGGWTVSPTSASSFIIFQVRNTTPFIVDAKCEVKAVSSGTVVYSLEQRLKPDQASDLDGAGDMYMTEQGERYSAGCEVSTPLL
jgi:hypothetical protein